MRILFSSTRGTGHLRPLLPYAHAFLARGDEVVVAAPASVDEALRKVGLAHAPFAHPGDEALGPIWARLRDLSEEDSTALFSREIFAGANARAALPGLEQTIRDFRPNLVVRDSVEFGSLIAAQAAGVPHASVAVHLVSFEDWAQSFIAEPIDVLRVAAGLAPDHGASLRSEPMFSAFPESLDAAAPRTPAPFRARMPEEEQEPANATWFDAADPRPLVYITFGTLVGSSLRERAVYRIALDAVAGLPVRAVLTTGHGFDAATLGTTPANVHVAPWIPQRDVLSRASAVVCHGGSGTLRGALAFGLPLVVVPLFADQPFNARRVATTGAGLAVPSPDAGALRAAVSRVLEEPSFRAGAEHHAGAIAALPPLADALDAMVALAASGPRAPIA